MKFNKWTVGLAAVGVVSLASAARADEKMNAVQTALSNTTLSGYVDTAATWRPGTDQKSGVGSFPGYAFSKNDGFSLNAVDIALDHPEDESPWAAGYRIELMLGPDAVGYGFAGTAGTDASGTFIRNAYVTLRTPVGNGIDWKVGVWDSILGYESTSSPLDPNYTRSYGSTILPRTYKINDMVSLQAGMADSLSGENPSTAGFAESQKSYMGGVTFTAPDSAGFMQGATLNFGAIDAAGGSGVGTSQGYTILHADATLPTPVKAVKVGAAFDYDDIHNGGVAANPANDSVWVVGLYGNFQATDKLSLNLRGEYLSNEGGLTTLSTPSADLGYGAAEELTATVQYNLWENVISRLEFRWDHVEHGNAWGPSVNATGTAPGKEDDFLLALNLIYQF